DQLGALLGAAVPSSWPPGFWDRDAMSYFHARLTEGGLPVAGWYAWYAILRACEGNPATLVASGGYVGPPSEDGTVEIGYSVASEWRGRGYATEMMRALVERAFATPDVRRVIADVHEANMASQKVLERCGLRRAGDGRDPGHHRFERLRHQAP